jgi:hypothetical protein
MERGQTMRARRINEQPWEALRGHRKVRCPECDFWFSRPKQEPFQEFCKICDPASLGVVTRRKQEDD